jgi:hypothetical protein
MHANRGDQIVVEAATLNAARRPSHARTAYPHHSALPPIRDVSPPGFGPGATADGPTSRRR